ncbi:MAG TPA: M20 family metallo-hydrolase, partial [Bryobacteraceae bacterium]
LTSELDTLATFSDTPAPAVTRIVFSEADRAARQWFKNLCAAANLTVREDAVGNTFARWIGSEPHLPAVGTGSHIDAIPHSGKYDGTVGVLGGLEAIRALQQSGFQPRRSIEVLMFTAEEPTRFGIGCLGSRLISGVLDAGADERLRDKQGSTLAQVRAETGFTGSLDDVRLPSTYYDAFVELHIEQGPLLERDKIPLGVVNAIAAPASARITIEGEGGHAGAVLMPHRRDAFLAACELSLAIERAVKSTGSTDTVGTVGICEVFPGAINSIPSRVNMTSDVRDTDLARRDRALLQIDEATREIAARRGVVITSETINADAPCVCAPRVVEALRTACSPLVFQDMVSRAYHDSLFMSRITQAAMLFIPCRGGVSHRPDEYSSPESIATGVAVLAQTLKTLAS